MPVMLITSTTTPGRENGFAGRKEQFQWRRSGFTAAILLGNKRSSRQAGECYCDPSVPGTKGKKRKDLAGIDQTGQLTAPATTDKIFYTQ
jgi:hypothetical protein